MNTDVLGSFYTLVVLYRNNNEIQFGRLQTFTYDRDLYPYFLTTPNNPPRLIVHEFDEPSRSIIHDFDYTDSEDCGDIVK